MKTKGHRRQVWKKAVEKFKAVRGFKVLLQAHHRTRPIK